jgi:hypothetical protein
LCDRAFAALLAGFEQTQLLGEFAHHVTAGYPHWQLQNLQR